MGRDTDFNFGHGSIADDLPDCNGIVFCARCGKKFGKCLTGVQLEYQEKNYMIQRGGSQQSQNGRNQGRKRTNAGVPFLTVEKLTFDKQAAKILAAQVRPDNFRQGQTSVVVKILLRSNTFLWTLREGNPNLDILCDAMGEDESQWNGREIFLFVEEDDFDGKKWIRSEVASTVGRSKK